MKIGLYGLAGFGAYAAYEHFSKKGVETPASTVPPISTEEATSSFTGTNWQQSGRNRETMWQEGNVFSNAAGGGRYLPTGIDRTARASESNQWLAAMLGRSAKPNGGVCSEKNPCNVFPNAAGGRGGYSRFAGDSRGTMMTMNVSNLVMGYLAIGLTAFVIGYSIKKGKELA